GVVSAFPFTTAASTQLYTLSLHDALPISAREPGFSGKRNRSSNGARRSDLPGVDRLFIAGRRRSARAFPRARRGPHAVREEMRRSEEHTSELQSLRHLVCRLLLEKKNTNN